MRKPLVWSLWAIPCAISLYACSLALGQTGPTVTSVVLSPSTYFNASASCPTSCAGAPGGVTNDSTIVPKP